MNIINFVRNNFKFISYDDLKVILNNISNTFITKCKDNNGVDYNYSEKVTFRSIGFDD